jgi:O-antigen ligase
VGGLVAAYPLGRILRAQRRLELLAWALLGLLPFLGSLDIGLVTDVTLHGDSHGVEVGLLDLLALALVFARPLSLRRVPYLGVITLYLLAVTLSITQAAQPVQAFYYLWRLARMSVVFYAVVRAAGSLLISLNILRGMAAGTIYELYLVLQQRFYLYQSPGSFSHQNSLGMALNLFLMVAVAAALARTKSWLVSLAPAAGLVVVVLTRSRGTLLLFLFGVLLVFVFSLLRRATARKLMVALLGTAVATAVVVKSAERIDERFENAPAESLETRKQFEAAAALMLADHPWGLGANHFSWTMENGGYADRAGLQYGNRIAIVHNIYLLTAVELGYVGLVALILLLTKPLIDAVHAAWRTPASDVKGDLLLGLGVGLLVCDLHGLVEWIWRATDVSYVFWIVLGMTGGLARRIRIEASLRARSKRVRPRQPQTIGDRV